MADKNTKKKYKGLGDRHMTQYWVSGPVPMTRKTHSIAE